MRTGLDESMTPVLSDPWQARRGSHLERQTPTRRLALSARAKLALNSRAEQFGPRLQARLDEGGGRNELR